MNKELPPLIKANPTQNFIQWTGENAADISDFLDSHDFYHKNGNLIVDLEANQLMVPLNGYLTRKSDKKGETPKRFSAKVPKKRNGEWQTHVLFETVEHLHMTWITDNGDVVDLMAVKCADGRWYACNDSSDIRSDLLFEPNANEFEEPVFFNSLEHLERVICNLVSEQLDVEFESLYPYFTNGGPELTQEYSEELKTLVCLNVSEIVTVVKQECGASVKLSNELGYIAKVNDIEYKNWQKLIKDYGLDMSHFHGS